MEGINSADWSLNYFWKPSGGHNMARTLFSRTECSRLKWEFPFKVGKGSGSTCNGKLPQTNGNKNRNACKILDLKMCFCWLFEQIGQHWWNHSPGSKRPSVGPGWQTRHFLSSPALCPGPWSFWLGNTWKKVKCAFQKELQKNWTGTKNTCVNLAHSNYKMFVCAKWGKNWLAVKCWFWLLKAISGVAPVARAKHFAQCKFQEAFWK